MQEDGEGWWLVLFTLNRNQKKMKGGGVRSLIGKILSTCVISAGTNMFLNGKFSTCQYKDNEENNSILQMQTFNYSLDLFEH